MNELHEPLYLQVQKIILNKIQSGEWPLHSKVTDEITLAEQLGVSRGTLRKSLNSLIKQGLLTKVQGKGTFVTSNIIQQQLASKLVSFAESMEQQGLNYTTVVIKQEVVVPDRKIISFLELKEGEKINYVERVRLVENYPVMYLKNYIAVKTCPELVTDDLQHDTIFHLIEHKYQHKIKWGRRYFRAVPALGDVVQNLGVAVSSPVMHLEQVVYDSDSVPLEYSNVWINSEKFDIISTLDR